MRTIKEFEKDFEYELETGMLIIADELSEATIFILEDGTIINAEFDGWGDRCTDHRQVLSDKRYSMDDLVTLEPESQTIILPDNGTTQEQYESLKGIEEIYKSLDVLGSQKNGTDIYLIQYLIDAGASWETAQGVVKSGSWQVIDRDDYENEYTSEEKDDFFFLDNGDIVDVW